MRRLEPRPADVRFRSVSERRERPGRVRYRRIGRHVAAAGRFNGTLTYASVPGCSLPACPGDLDGNRMVDTADLGLMLLDFGPCAGCQSDFDGNGSVDPSDVSLLLIDFGDCDPCPCWYGCG